MDIIFKGRQTDVAARFREYATAKLNRLVKLDAKALRVDVEVSVERNPRQASQKERVELTVRSRGPAIRAEAAAEDRLAALDLALAKLDSRLRRALDRRKRHNVHYWPDRFADLREPEQAELSEGAVLPGQAKADQEGEEPAGAATGIETAAATGAAGVTEATGATAAAGAAGGDMAAAGARAGFGRRGRSARKAAASAAGADGRGFSGGAGLAGGTGLAEGATGSVSEDGEWAGAGHDGHSDSVVPITMEGDGPVVVRQKFHRADPISIDQALLEMELVGHDFYLFHDIDKDMPSVVYRRRGYQYGVIRLVENSTAKQAAPIAAQAAIPAQGSAKSAARR